MVGVDEFHVPPPEELSSFPEPPEMIATTTTTTEVNYTGGEKFPQKTAFRDWPFALLFVLHLLSLAPLLVIGFLGREDSESPITPSPSVTPDDDSIQPSFKALSFFGFVKLVGVAVMSGVIGIAFSAFWYYLMKTFPRPMVYVSFIASGVFTILFGVAVILLGGFFFGIILILCGVVMGLLLYLLKDKIEFTVILLKTTVDLVNQFKGTLYVSLGGAVAYILWYLVWVSIFLIWSTAVRIPAILIIVGMIYLFLSLVWTIQVIKNVVHTTVAGTIATWYFKGNNAITMPPNPTLYSLQRSCTTSFGSICLGSLIVAILSTLSLLASIGEKESKNAFIKIAAMIVKVILKLLEGFVKFINKYAFTQVAIYGKTYIQAAVDTFRMFSHFGVDAIITDSLIGTVLGLGSLLGALICAGFACLLALIVNPSYFFLSFAVGFCIGYGLILIAFETIHSASIALFVCFVEQPSVVRDRLPDLHAKLQERYHAVCAALFISI